MDVCDSVQKPHLAKRAFVTPEQSRKHKQSSHRDSVFIPLFYISKQRSGQLLRREQEMMQSEFLFLTTAVVRHVISGLCTLDALEINDMEMSDVKSSD